MNPSSIQHGASIKLVGIGAGTLGVLLPGIPRCGAIRIGRHGSGRRKRKAFRRSPVANGKSTYDGCPGWQVNGFILQPWHFVEITCR
jgi:hypothetical protein